MSTDDVYNAAEKGAAALQAVLNARIDINTQTEDGRTALYRACQRGHDGTAKLLVDENADPDLATYENGLTPIIIASLYGHTGCVKLLIEAKADLTRRDKKNETALDKARRNKKAEIVALLEAAAEAKAPPMAAPAHMKAMEAAMDRDLQAASSRKQIADTLPQLNEADLALVLNLVQRLADH